MVLVGFRKLFDPIPDPIIWLTGGKAFIEFMFRDTSRVLAWLSSGT
jgi:hypothetical protein